MNDTKLGYVVLKNGAAQRTYNFPHMLEHALLKALQHAQSLYNMGGRDAYDRPSIVKVVETFENPKGGVNILGDTVLELVCQQQC